jgi:uncharacterized protein (TIGR00369 family)
MSARTLEELWPAVGVNRTLGLRLVARERDTLGVVAATVRMAATGDLAQGYGLVQGGVISALADAAAVCCFLADEPRAADALVPTSIEFKVNFLRPARPSEGEQGELEARAKVVKRGKRIGLAEVDVTQAGELVAKGLFTYLLERA